MSGLDALPLWAAVLVALLILAGALITLAGTVGLMRFPTFYQRIHAPTLGTSFGAFFVLVGSMVFFSVTEARPVLHEVLIIIFVTVTTPVTLMLLARASLYRDRAEGSPDVPAEPNPAAPPTPADPTE